MDIAAIELLFNTLKGSIPDKKNQIELNIRKGFHQMLKTQNFEFCDEIEELLNLCLDLSEKGVFCNNNFIFLILSDFFEIVQMNSLESSTEFLITIMTRLISEPLYNCGKFTLLRICNDIIKRLSHIKDPIICGKIQMNLSKLFPINERSAINIIGEHNSDKIQYIMLGEDDQNEPKNYRTSSCNEDFFFSKFWEIQECLNNPDIILISESSWDKFKNNFDTILKVFKTIEMSIHESEFNNCHSLGSDQFFPKYTANPHLITMQIEDFEFRQQILLQYYIMISHLKDKGSLLKDVSFFNKEWCDEVLDKIITIIQKYDNLSQSDFYSYMQIILKNEEIWVDWKKRGCPSLLLNKYPVSEPSIKFDFDLKDFDFDNQQTFENPRLNHLWNICPDNLEACRLDRNNVFSTDSFSNFLQSYGDAIKSPEMFHKLCQQSSFQWKALRLLAKNYTNFFSTPSSTSLPSFIYNQITNYASK